MTSFCGGQSADSAHCTKGESGILKRIFQPLHLILFLLVTGSFVESTTLGQGAEGKIAFLSNLNGKFGIYIMDADGANPTNLTRGGGPAWSPDGLQIAFYVGNDLLGSDISVVDLFGNNLWSLTNNRIDLNIFPAWSPDGTKIAFVSNRGGNRDIYIMTADGKNPKNLTWDLLEEDRPSWSPDGKKIVFGAYQRNHQKNRGESDIFMIDADGANRINLTQDPPAINSYPSWSPDRKKIAYSASPKPHLWFAPFNIHVMNADGTNPIMLTKAGRWIYESRPNWSPDGKRIVFTRQEPDGTDDIYSMYADGSGLINLTQSPRVQDNSPSWRPKGLSVTLRRKLTTQWGTVKQN